MMFNDDNNCKTYNWLIIFYLNYISQLLYNHLIIFKIELKYIDFKISLEEHNLLTEKQSNAIIYT